MGQKNNLLTGTFILSNITVVVLVSCVIARKFGIKFEPNINFEPIINSVLALFLAIFIPISVGRSLENKKSSRELLIGLCCVIQTRSQELIELVAKFDATTDKETNRQKIFDYVKIIGSHIKCLKDNGKDQFGGSFKDGHMDVIFDPFDSAMTEDTVTSDFSFNNAYILKIRKAGLNFFAEIEKVKFHINSL